MDARKTINDMLVTYFHQILDMEGKAIISEEFSDISNNDMHIIEAIGMGEGSKMSDIARRLNITVGSLTTSMNALVKKQYVARKRSEEDRRVVYIYLLDKGIAAYKHHEEFHKKMTDALLEVLTEEEVDLWVKSFIKLNEFFTQAGQGNIL